MAKVRAYVYTRRRILPSLTKYSLQSSFLGKGTSWRISIRETEQQPSALLHFQDERELQRRSVRQHDDPDCLSTHHGQADVLLRPCVRRILPSSVGCNEEHVGIVQPARRPGPPHGDPQLQILARDQVVLFAKARRVPVNEARWIVGRDRRALDAQITVSVFTRPPAIRRNGCAGDWQRTRPSRHESRGLSVGRRGWQGGGRRVASRHCQSEAETRNNAFHRVISLADHVRFPSRHLRLHCPAGTGPAAIDRKKYGSQKSHAASRSRLSSRTGTSSARYLSEPRPLPVGCLNAGQWTTLSSSVFGLPVAAKRVQYPAMARKSPRSSAFRT